MLTGSQKSLALPPGLAFGVARPALLERAKAKPDRGIYFDFIEFEKNIQKNQTPNTPAVSLFYALDAQLDAICRETIEARWERHADMARRTWEWADDMKGRGIDVRVLAPRGIPVADRHLHDDAGRTHGLGRHGRAQGARLYHRDGLRRAQGHHVPHWPHGRSHGR